MKKLLLLFVLAAYACTLSAQKRKFDSLAFKLAEEKIDSNRVKLMWQMADASNMYNPDTSLHLAQQALSVAQKNKLHRG